MSTNVPAPTFGPNGFIVPDDEDILAGVFADINEAFGGNLNPAPTTPQGQLATSLAAIISNADAQFLLLTQNVDPAYAAGRMQDAIGRIYFIERLPARPTVAECVCVGLAGTLIPAGSTAIDEDGNIFTCTSGGTIPVGGSITLPFACNTLGPVACPENTLNQIYQTIPGWDSVNNPADGTLGRNTETRAEFEARRAASVAVNSAGSLPSILGAVLSVPNVLDAYVTENDTGSPVTIGTGDAAYTLDPNSLYVAAIGGEDADVAKAIWTKKAPGCAYNGNTTVTVEDQNPGYTPPYPSYDVKFERPPPLTIWFKVDLVDSPQIPSNATALIQAAIISAFAGADGGPRARMGTNILATRFIGPIAALGPWAQVRSIKLGSTNTSSASFTGAIAGTNLTASSVTGTIGIGDIVTDTTGNIVPGTKIVSQSSGSPGGAGVYVISQTQTVASEAAKSLPVDEDVITVGIAQAPVTSSLNIAVEAT